MKKQTEVERKHQQRRWKLDAVQKHAILTAPLPYEAEMLAQVQAAREAKGKR